MSNTSDNRFAIIKETVRGVTPATPAFSYVDVVKGGSTIKYAEKELTSETMRQNRSAGPMRKVAGSFDGPIKMVFRRDKVITDLLAGVCSATLSGSTYKAGNTDTTFSYEEIIPNNSGGSNYFRYKNANVSKATITVDAESSAMAEFTIVGGEHTFTTAPLTGATYTSTTKGIELTGIESSINIAGLTGSFLRLELSIEQQRDPNFKLGQKAAFDVSTNSARKITLTLKMFRDDIAPEVLFSNDTPVAVSVTLGSGANGYRFDFPACVGSFPGKEEGTQNMVTLVLTAQGDAVTGDDASFTLLS